MKSLVALWLGVEGLTDQPAAIGHTEGWSAIARGLCGLETSDARLREGSRLKAGGFRSGRGVPLAHAPFLSDPSVEEGGDVGPFRIVGPWLNGICACFERCSYARNRWCCEAPPASHEAVRAVAGARKCPEGELLGGVRCSRVALCTNDHGCCLCRDASTRTLYSIVDYSSLTRVLHNPLGVALRCVWVVWQWDSGVLLGGAWCLTSVASKNMVRFLL